MLWNAGEFIDQFVTFPLEKLEQFVHYNGIQMQFMTFTLAGKIPQ
jgi:hypothetical protein